MRQLESIVCACVRAHFCAATYSALDLFFKRYKPSLTRLSTLLNVCPSDDWLAADDASSWSSSWSLSDERAGG